MTSREALEQFAAKHGAVVTVTKNGTHWFHTPEQLAVLHTWENGNLS